MTTRPLPLESMVAKADSLYTLPAVAMEVIRLTDTHDVDTQALKQCIEQDPALAAKLLRVVNSSLFGLSGKVENLTQALALLGIKPLKLLVLGFSLPDGLLADLDVDQLRNYWRTALTRAVAARQLVETHWRIPGDDAFLVALLQDIGILVLLQQLKTPYARFLTHVRDEQQRLEDLEQASLGFDHRKLTAELLRKWQLPEVYTGALVRQPSNHCSTDPADAHQITPQVLQLANLLTELVDHHRLNVLPDLLELGDRYIGLTKEDLNCLVAELEPQVAQLAAVLRIDLAEREQYAAVLAEAHRQLAILAEDAAGQLALSEEQMCEQIIRDTQELQQAMQEFARHAPTTTSTAAATDGAERTDAAEQRGVRPHGLATTVPTQAGARQRLLAGVAALLPYCRERREPLTLLLCHAASGSAGDDAASAERGSALMSAVDRVSTEFDLRKSQVFRITADTVALLLPLAERSTAVEMVRRMNGVLCPAATPAEPATAQPVQIKAGIAFVSAIANGFAAERLVLAAEGCLAAASASGGAATKSIEVY